MPVILEQVSPETAQALIAQATATGLSIDDYLKQLLGMVNGTQPVLNAPVEEFLQAMESLAEKNVEPLPRNFSREDIYFPED